MLNHTYAHIVCLNNNEIDIALYDKTKQSPQKMMRKVLLLLNLLGHPLSVSQSFTFFLQKKIMKTTQSKSEPSECMKEKIMTQT